MSTPILMPALSPTMEEGTLAKWRVKEGDKVEPGQVIAEIETDKATMDFEAVDEGVIEKILVPEGTENVKVQTPIAEMSGEASAATPAKFPPEAAAKAPERPAPAVSTRETTPPPTGAREGGERTLSSPLARRMAAQAGLALELIEGTGPHGRIIKRDVEAAIEAKARGRELAPFKPAAPAAPKPLAPPFREGEYAIEKMDGMKKAIARRMTAAFRDVPHFPLTIDVELDRLMSARKQLNARLEGEGVKLSVNDILIRACALSLKRVPDSNVSFAGDSLLKHKHAHVAVAVAVPGGLITPVIFYAEQKGLAEISREMKALAEKARNRKLLPPEYEGGTFTISNLGMYGIKSFASILNEPQAMILSVGAGEARPVVKEGALAIATMMTMTLTCDHRAVDGAIGADFLGALRTYIEDPMMMMA
jgi:pyruvate dehydrogenase E2 component (dihydrolipoamide acetyltransferase)